MRIVAYAWLLAAMSACTLYFDHGKNKCDQVAAGTAAGEIAQQEQRYPDNLSCQTFGSPDQCDPDCGPCPVFERPEAVPAPPSWGVCGSPCDSLDETSCTARS